MQKVYIMHNVLWIWIPSRLGILSSHVILVEGGHSSLISIRVQAMLMNSNCATVDHSTDMSCGNMAILISPVPRGIHVAIHRHFPNPSAFKKDSLDTFKVVWFGHNIALHHKSRTLLFLKQRIMPANYKTLLNIEQNSFMSAPSQLPPRHLNPHLGWEHLSEVVCGFKGFMISCCFKYVLIKQWEACVDLLQQSVWGDIFWVPAGACIWPWCVSLSRPFFCFLSPLCVVD